MVRTVFVPINLFYVRQNFDGLKIRALCRGEKKIAADPVQTAEQIFVILRIASDVSRNVRKNVSSNAVCEQHPILLLIVLDICDVKPLRFNFVNTARTCGGLTSPSDQRPVSGINCAESDEGVKELAENFVIRSKCDPGRKMQ